MSSLAVLSDLDPATYQRHELHAEERIWVEKNCYIDVWIELIHALGLDPMAMLGFTVALDFNGDQWTFFKPPHGELFDLYGVEVQELNVWRSLTDHAVSHLAEGELVATEADAYWLPDTAGTDYRAQHTKTTIIIQQIDVERRKLGYFHNAAYFGLEGEDFVELFRSGVVSGPMPLFAELVRIDRRKSRPRDELAGAARELLRRHLARRPADNPVLRFRERFERELPWLQEEGLDFYHAWAFANLRQLGAAFELAATHVSWLDGEAFEPVAESFLALSAAAKTLILKAARSVNRKRAVDAGAQFEEMAAGWERGMRALATELEV